MGHGGRSVAHLTCEPKVALLASMSLDEAQPYDGSWYEPEQGSFGALLGAGSPLIGDTFQSAGYGDSPLDGLDMPTSSAELLGSLRTPLADTTKLEQIPAILRLRATSDSLIVAPTICVNSNLEE